MAPIPLPLTEEEATGLYQRGQYSDATYNQVLDAIRARNTPPVPTPTPAPITSAYQAPPPPSQAPTLPAAEPTPIPTAAPAAPAPSVAPTVNIPDSQPAPAAPAQPAAPGSLASDPAAPIDTGQDDGSSNIEKEFNTGIANKAIAAKMEADANVRKANLQSDFYAQQADRLKQYQAENAKRDLDSKTQLDEFAQQYQNAINTAANAKVDPNHYWADKTTSQKILASIAIALGGVGQALSNEHKNYVLEMIQKSITEDIDAQKENISKGFQAASQKGSLYSIMRSKFDDDRQATLAAQSAGLKIVEAQAQSQISKVDGDMAKAKGQDLIGALDIEAGKLDAQVLALKKQSIDTDTLSQLADTRGADAVARAVENDPEKRPRLVNQQVVYDYTTKPDGTQVPKIKTIIGLASTPEQKKEIDEGQQKLTALLQNLTDLRDLRAVHQVEGNIFNTNSDARARAKILSAEFAANYAQAKGMNSLRGVLPVVDKMLDEDPLGPGMVDPIGFFERAALMFGKNDAVLSQIDQIRDSLMKSTDNMFNPLYKLGNSRLANTSKLDAKRAY